MIIRKNLLQKKTKSLKTTQKYFNESKSLSQIEIKEFSLLYLILNNLNIFQENVNLIENIKLFTNENNLVFKAVLSKLKSGNNFDINDCSTQRNLNENGIEESKKIGLFFKAAPEAKILRSL